MDKGSRNRERMQGSQRSSLAELIHAAVRRAIEVAVDEELIPPWQRGRTSALKAGEGIGTARSPAR